ncbi:octopamine receptor beta-2R-like [Oculina patagonica]
MSNNTNAKVHQPSQNETMGIDTEAIAELVPVAFLIIIANGLVLVLFAKRTQLRTPVNYVLFSLAACDFMTGIINIPLFIIVAFTSVFVSFGFRVYTIDLVSALKNFTAISACYHILAATSEKYLAIIWPVTHRLMSRKTVFNVLKVVWVVSFILAFIPFAWVTIEDRETQAKLDLGHVIFCLVVVFLLPYALMIYAFVVIFKSISNQGKCKGSFRSRAHSCRQAGLEKRCLILFASMATVFLVCWLPWFILMLLYRVIDNAVEGLETPAHVFVLVRYATSIINPALYTFFRRDFKTALKSLCKNERSRHFSFPLFSRDTDVNKTASNVVDDTPENVV